MTITRCLVTALASFTSLTIGACGDDEISTPKDTFEVLDTFVPADTAITTATDTGVTVPDTSVTDTGTPDTGVADTVVADTAVTDTAVADTAVADSSVADVADVADSSVSDTGVADTAVADTAVADTSVTDTSVTDTSTGPQVCPPSANETVVTKSTVFTGQTYSGAQNAVQFTSDMCSDPPDSTERVYRFDLAAATEVYAETDCGWDCELVVTKDGCDNANVIDCATSLGDEIYAGTLGAGAYRVFVEGDDPEDPDNYDFMLNLNHTTGQDPCTATAINVTNPLNCQDPFSGSPRFELLLENQNLTLADTDHFFFHDVDGCDKDDSRVGGAPDKVYSFTLTAEREVDITLSPDGWDAMLAVTGPGGPCGAVSKVVECSDDLVGSDESLSLTLGAGTWYIVVDGFGEETFGGGAHGPFELEVLVFDDACNE